MNQSLPSTRIAVHVPPAIQALGKRFVTSFLEFFAAHHRNKNTRDAYARDISSFLKWCECRSIALPDVEPLTVSMYVEEMTENHPARTVKRHLSALKGLFDYLVVTGAMGKNPAQSVKGPKMSERVGATPVLSPQEVRLLLTSIDVSTLRGLRDRAILGTMLFSFCRVGALIKLKIGDFHRRGNGYFLRLHEKGGKVHEIPCHPIVQDFILEYIKAAELREDKNAFLFQTMRGRSFRLSGRPLHRNEILYMVKHRALKAGINCNVRNHSFRASGLTNYLTNGGSLEIAQRLAGHSSPRTTKLYDRREQTVDIEEVKKVRF